MEKTPPPPYSAAAYTQQPGFVHQPPNPQGYGQPQPGYPQHGYVQPPQGNSVVMVAPVVTVFGPESQTLQCPHCHHQITTRVESEAGTKTHLFALLLCLFGCVPCCIIPYCTDSCQNRNHYCPSCGAYLGVYNN